jgi:hypothetical protein
MFAVIGACAYTAKITIKVEIAFALQGFNHLL